MFCFRSRWVLLLTLVLTMTCWALGANAAAQTVPEGVAVTTTIVMPVAGAMVGDNLLIRATVNSVLAVDTVVATVEGRTANLLFNNGEFSAVLSLAGLARGTKMLTVVATDVFGGVGQDTVSFLFDQRPSVTIALPLEGAVVRPTLRVVASCTDDDPAGCSSMEVCFLDCSSGPDLVVLGAQVDATFDLTPEDGRSFFLQVFGTDSAGQRSTLANRLFNVELNELLVPLAAVDGHIWDADVAGDRLLYWREEVVSGEGTDTFLAVTDFAGGSSTVIEDDPLRHAGAGLLTPTGAVFMDSGPTVVNARIRDWNLGQFFDLGFPNSAGWLERAGRYVIWANSPDLFLRDVVDRTTTTVTTDAGNFNNAVGPGGEVAYWSGPPNSQIHLTSPGGASTQLTSDPVLWNSYPRTNGQSVLYRKHTACCSNQTFEVYLHDGIQETLLADHGAHQPKEKFDYEITGNWIAFTRPGAGGNRQVWLRSAAGVETQISFFGQHSQIAAVGPSGEVVFSSNNRAYAASVDMPFPPQELGAAYKGYFFWEGNHLFRAYDGELFAVNVFLDVFSDGFEGGDTSAWSLVVQ